MPEQLKNYFYLSQIGLGALFLGVAWLLLRGRDGESKFRVREADLRPRGKPGTGGDLANARLNDAKPGDNAKPGEKKRPALALPGVRLEGTPYQILGISEAAGKEEIQRAFRELMKRFHPDKVGAQPGTAAWKDAQKVAEIINRARADALARASRARR